MPVTVPPPIEALIVDREALVRAAVFSWIKDAGGRELVIVERR